MRLVQRCLAKEIPERLQDTSAVLNVLRDAFREMGLRFPDLPPVVTPGPAKDSFPPDADFSARLHGRVDELLDWLRDHFQLEAPAPAAGGPVIPGSNAGVPFPINGNALAGAAGT